MTFSKFKTLLTILTLFYFTLTGAKAENQSDSILLAKTQLLAKNYQFDPAIKNLEEMIKRDSTNFEACSLLENLYFKTSQYRPALLMCEHLLQNKIDINYYTIRKAISWKKMGRNQKSLNIFLQAYKIDTANTFINTQIGDLYKTLLIPDSAIIYYDRTCKIKPSSSVIIKAMAVHLSKKQNEEALKFFNTYYKPEFGHNFLLLRLYGRTQYLNGKIASAKKTFKKLNEAGDSTLVTLKYLGMCHWKLEEYYNGMLMLEKYIAKKNDDFQAYYMLGACCVKCHHHKTLEYLNTALELIQVDSRTINRIYDEIALFHQQNRNYDLELSTYFIMKEHEPNSTYVDYKIATLYDYGFKNREEALSRYKELLALYETDTANQDSDVAKFCKTRIDELKEQEFWNKQ